MTPSEENAFVQALKQHIGKPGSSKTRCTRDDATALMGILRSGSNLDSALTFAPGLRPRSLLAAYEKLEKRRALSAKAWANLCRRPGAANLSKQKKHIEKILPVVVKELTIVARAGGGLINAVKKYEADIKTASSVALAREKACLRAIGSPGGVYLVVAALYDPNDPASSYMSPLFLPDRVAVLSPSRVDALWK